MRTSHKLPQWLFSFALFILLSASATLAARAADPGIPFPFSAASSDQKAGSLLVYNVYTSGAINFTHQNARLGLTNTSDFIDVAIHLFFVDGATCSVADSYVCLTANQTINFLASDLDPGVTGYLIVLAVNAQGCPIRHNFLIGDLYVKFASGHSGNLGAEAFAAQYEAFTGCSSSSTTATLVFDTSGVANSYNPLPRTVAADNIPDISSNNNTMLIVNRIGGNLATGVSTLGAIAGILYDDGENGFSFTFTSGACQFRSTLSNVFPRTAPRFETIIPSGRSGWMKLYADSPAAGLLGATINHNSNSTTTANAFNGARNLHHLTYNNSGGGSVGLTIPVFPPGC
ncbi:MAG: hypothetical protein ABIU20_11380 [Blastocatellia bacterium]